VIDTAFVLGGGGVLGSAEVGMLRALLERRIVPDLIVGCSVGALNGAALACSPDLGGVAALAETWTQLQARDVFSSSVVGQVANLVRYGTHLHDNASLRALIEAAVQGRRFEDLQVPFECVAACVETAGAHWFQRGPVADAVLASSAVPGLLPPVGIGGRHYFDGGLVASVPVGRAVDRGAKRIFVLHVGRLEQPLRVPSRPWEVATVAFEIARRHQFADDMARLPEGAEVHLLPSGSPSPGAPLRYRHTTAVSRRIDAAYEACCQYLEQAAAT
jgi:NTE family protein